jgi:cytidylate kinase
MAIITISRGSMSGGEALAASLGQVLGYRTVAREVLIAAAEELGVPEEALAQKIAWPPGLWERMSSHRKFFVVAVQAALAEHAAQGDLVYHGHAGHLLLRGLPGVLRVRLIAPLEMRVRAVMERRQLGRTTAEQYIHDVDESRVRWTRFIYDVDWRDPALYDVVVNLEKMSLAAASAMIAAAVKLPEFTATEEAAKARADFLLGCRVKVALAKNPLTRDLGLEAVANAGTVEIRGELPRVSMLTHRSRRDEREILQLAREVSGVEKVLLNLHSTDVQG